MSKARAGGPDRPQLRSVGGVAGRVERALRLAHAYRQARLAVPRPRTFNDKIIWRMAHDRRPILTTFCDKDAVRDYVAAAVGPDVLPKLLAVSSDPAGIAWSGLPRNYACKVTHGSGGVILVWDGASPEARLPDDVGGVGWTRFVVRPDEVERGRMVDLLEHWLSQSYEWLPGRVPEWGYRGVPPRVMVEELVTDRQGALPVDYKFFVFGGICRAVLVKSDQFGTPRLDLLSRDWEWLPVVKEGVARSGRAPERPEALGRMIEIAETLAAPLDFERVDLYAVGSRVVFGELTSYPAGGTNAFDPAWYDSLWGSYWSLDRHVRRRHVWQGRAKRLFSSLTDTIRFGQGASAREGAGGAS